MDKGRLRRISDQLPSGGRLLIGGGGGVVTEVVVGRDAGIFNPAYLRALF
jgi:hypothetical protein